jgi:glutathione synthase/RimK-type ligase-like ATP-grasp enzyme
MILIFTRKQDTHTDEVIKLLSKKDIKVFRLNSEDILSKYKVNLSIPKDGLWEGEIVDQLDRILDLKQQKVAWLRKPDFNFFGDHPDKSAEEFFAESETKAFINSIYSLPNIKWINPPFIANGAKVKFQQLLLANKMGIKTPKTIITNQPELAKEFFVSCGEEVLIKSIYTANVTIDGLNQAIPSRKIGKDQFYPNYQNISLCPTQLQEYVEKAFELRITIIGQKVFAVKIDSQVNEETKIDWRLHTKMNPHSIYELPDHIEKFCIDFLNKQGLVYGAMDFIVTPQGEYYFLENNPFGQYLWLEIETGIPLTETMCDLLISYAQE